MLKEKKLNKATEENSTTIEDIQKQRKAKQAELDQAKISNNQAQSELNNIQQQKVYRERRLARQKETVQQAEQDLQNIKAYATYAPIASAVQIAKSLNERQQEFDTAKRDLEAISTAHETALQDENTQIAQLCQTIQESAALIASLEGEIASLEAQQRKLHDAEGQALYASLERELAFRKEHVQSIVEAEKAAADAARAARYELVQGLADASRKLSAWPSLQTKLHYSEPSKNTASERFLESYLSHVKLIRQEWRDIDNPPMSLPSHSLLKRIHH
jgi:chromosome segregation ATPase